MERTVAGPLSKHGELGGEKGSRPFAQCAALTLGEGGDLHAFPR